MLTLPLGVLAVSAAVFTIVWLLFANDGRLRHRTRANLNRGLTGQGPGGVRRTPGQGWQGWARSVTSPAARGYLEKLLVRAGRPKGWPVERVVLAKLGLLAVGALVGLALFSLMRSPVGFVLAVFLAALFFFLPDLRLYSKGIERRQAISLQLPDTLDQMSIAVHAGLGFDAAMIRVARNGKGELAREMIRAMQDIQVGQPRRVAYTELGERCGVPELRRFMRSIVQAETYGLALSDVLHTQADEMRIQRRQRAEAKAMEIPVKVVFPLILCILPVIFIVLLGPAVIRILDAFGVFTGR